MLVLLAQLLIQDPRAAFTKESFKIILPHKQSRTPTPGTHTHTHTLLHKKQISPQIADKIKKLSEKTQKRVNTHESRA